MLLLKWKSVLQLNHHSNAWTFCAHVTDGWSEDIFDHTHPPLSKKLCCWSADHTSFIHDARFKQLLEHVSRLWLRDSRYNISFFVFFSDFDLATKKMFFWISFLTAGSQLFFSRFNLTRFLFWNCDPAWFRGKKPAAKIIKGQQKSRQIKGVLWLLITDSKFNWTFFLHFADKKLQLAMRWSRLVDLSGASFVSHARLKRTMQWDNANISLFMVW